MKLSFEINGENFSIDADKECDAENLIVLMSIGTIAVLKDLGISIDKWQHILAAAEKKHDEMRYV